jgi:hypothetical protein
MPDVLIRDVSEQDVAALDEQADRLGISRADLLRRLVAAQARRSAAPVTKEDLLRFAELAQDLDDPAVMRGAWG